VRIPIFQTIERNRIPTERKIWTKCDSEVKVQNAKIENVADSVDKSMIYSVNKSHRPKIHIKQNVIFNIFKLYRKS
jgi:hypothetical protein